MEIEKLAAHRVSSSIPVMTIFLNSAILFLLLAVVVCSSPLNDFNLLPRALSPAQCSSVVSVVSVLKVYRATPFCESFLSVKTQTPISITLLKKCCNFVCQFSTFSQYYYKNRGYDNGKYIVGLP